MIRIIVSVILLTYISLFALEHKTIESQPQILFKHKKLKQKQIKRELLLKFNTAVLYLEQEKYLHAIALFKQSAKLLKIPSYLNIGIAYYKLHSYKNAYLYLKKLYMLKELKTQDRYTYLSAAYYLYKITNNPIYINQIVKIGAKAKILTDQEKLLVVDTLILQKKYKYAFKLAKTVKNISWLKVALLAIKLRDYTIAREYLNKAFIQAKGDEAQNTVLWFSLYRSLKANEISDALDIVTKIDDRRSYFHTNNTLPLELYFNKNRFTPKQYLEQIMHPTYDRKLDFVYYFAPFIFEDYDAMSAEEKKGFVMKNQNSISQLNTMIKYNAQFLEASKLDPIKRVQVLQKLIDQQYDTQAYEYYNLALSYAQIYDYKKAYKYFKKAYNLDHGNKLYAVMTYITTKKFNTSENKIFLDILTSNILSKKGSFVYLAQYLYKVLEDPQMKLDKKYLTYTQKKSIFFRALYFLENIQKKGIVETEPLLVEFKKDPLVYLLNLISKKKDEDDYMYISRMQDIIPKVYNNKFLKGNLVVTDLYLDTLHALGLFYTTNLIIPHENTPTYLRTQAIVSLYKQRPKKAIQLIELLQDKYELDSIDSFYILVAGLLSSDQKELAYATLTELDLLYNDKDARFLGGIKVLQSLKLSSAPQYFKDKLKGKFIDFRIKNFDDYLESL